MGPMRAREKEFAIAVVDGEAALREALSTLLRPAGYGVRTFASAEDFFASEDWRSVDCLILDAQLPGMSGLELAANGFQVPVSAATGGAEALEILREALALLDCRCRGWMDCNWHARSKRIPCSLRCNG